MANVIKDNKCFRDVAQCRQTVTIASLNHGESTSDVVLFKRENADILPTGFACVASLHPNVVGGTECLIDVKCVCTEVTGISGVDTGVYIYVTNNSPTDDVTDLVISVSAI